MTVKVAGTLNPPTLPTEGEYDLEDYLIKDVEDDPDVANTEMYYFQALIGDEEYDIRLMRVGGDKEAEAYRKFLQQMGEDIGNDCNFHASQYCGEPDMQNEEFDTLEEAKARVKEIFDKAREKHRQEENE